jgi:hypothetical protein
MGRTDGERRKYVGNEFQIVSGRYTTSDKVSGTIQLSAILPPNLTNEAVALDGWDFPMA